MKCHQCGTEIFEGNSFCHVCGATVVSAQAQAPVAPVQPVQPVQAAAPQPQNPYINAGTPIAPPPVPAKSKSKLPIILAALLAVAVIGIVIAVLVLGGDKDSDGGESTINYEENRSSYSWLIDEWAEADFLNRTALVDLYHDDHLDYFLDVKGITYSELVNHYRVDDQEQEQLLNSKFGEGWECTYTLVDVDQYSGSQLKSVQNDFQQACGIDVEAYLELSIDLYMEGTKTSTESNFSLNIMLVDGQWYLAKVLE